MNNLICIRKFTIDYSSFLAPIVEKILFAGFDRLSLTAAGSKKIATESGKKLQKHFQKFTSKQKRRKIPALII